MSNRPPLEKLEFSDLWSRADDCCVEICTAYMGPPLKVSRHEMRWGTKSGSFSLVISGRKRGCWIDHNGSPGGRMAAFLRLQHGGDWSRAIDAALRFTGYVPPSWAGKGLSDKARRAQDEDARRRREEQARKREQEQAKQKSQGAGAYASRIYKESVPITGTLAERYIRDVRLGGHDLPVPGELRFHPHVWCHDQASEFPALIISCHHNGKLVRIQAILLDHETGKKLDIDMPKRTFGAGFGHVPASFAPWDTSEPQLQFLVEGPEDAIVLKACIGKRADASLGAGSLHKPRYPAGTRLVIVGDNGETGHRQAQRAEAVHRANGCDVTVIFPPEDLKDSNDVLLQRGPDGVRAWVTSAIEEAQRPKPPALPPLQAYYPFITEPRDQAKQRQEDIILTFFAQGARIADARGELKRLRTIEMADQPNLTRAAKAAITKRLHIEVARRFGFGRRIPKPLRTLLTGSQGTGKTTEALKAVAAIEAAVIVHKYAPTLDKCYEDLADYQKIATERSMPAYVVRGRGQDDPRTPDKKMCRRHVVVKQVIEAGLSPRQKICPDCKFREVCGTLRQAREINELGNRAVFFMAGAYAFLPCPAPEPGIIIADECLTMDAVVIRKVPVDILTQQTLLPYRGGNLGQAMEAGRILDGIRRSLMEPKALAALREARIDQDALRTLRQMLDETPIVDIDGTMPDETIKSRVDDAINWDRKMALVLISALQHEIDMPRDTLSGVVFDSKKNVFRVSSLKQPMRTKSASLLLLDGTGSENLNSTLFGPNLHHEVVRFERDAEVIGTAGRRYARQSITGLDADGKEIESRKDDSEQLRQDIGTIVARNPKFLVVAAKAAEDALLKHIPSSTETTHFGNLRGKNDWKKLPGVVSVGQQSLSIVDLEMTARAYLARDPERFFTMADPIPDDWPHKQWPYRATRMRRMRGGTLQPIEVDIHPDPRVQEVFEQLREAECIQGIDRPRPVYNRRTIIAMNELVLDLTYDKILTHRELVQGDSRIERALARTGVLPESREELVRVFPDIFTSPAMAQRDLQAWLELSDQKAKDDTLWKMITYFYRRSGQRGRPSKVWISEQFQDVRVAAEAVLGELTMLEPTDRNEAKMWQDPAPEPTPEPAPEPASDAVVTPEPTPVPPTPILGTLRVTQADSIVVPLVVGSVRLTQQEQKMLRPIAPPPAAKPRPPLPEPDYGDLEFWNQHEFFRKAV